MVSLARTHGKSPYEEYAIWYTGTLHLVMQRRRYVQQLRKAMVALKLEREWAGLLAELTSEATIGYFPWAPIVPSSRTTSTYRQLDWRCVRLRWAMRYYDFKLFIHARHPHHQPADWCQRSIYCG